MHLGRICRYGCGQWVEFRVVGGATHHYGCGCGDGWSDPQQRELPTSRPPGAPWRWPWPWPLTFLVLCRDCGAEVFFHTNGFGDAVLLEELGPPWTIHGCWIDRWPRLTRHHDRGLLRDLSVDVELQELDQAIPESSGVWRPVESGEGRLDDSPSDKRSFRRVEVRKPTGPSAPLAIWDRVVSRPSLSDVYGPLPGSSMMVELESGLILCVPRSASSIFEPGRFVIGEAVPVQVRPGHWQFWLRKFQRADGKTVVHSPPKPA